MSLIENALKKLQASGAEPGSLAVRAPAPRAGSPQSSNASVARKEKISLDGPKHHVEPAALVRSGLLPPEDHASAVADEFRLIKRPLIVNAFAPEPRPRHANVIMITSAMPKAGKTFCAINLAMSISLERDINVVLVDADVAKPHISRELGLAEAPGLIDLLLDENTAIADVLVRTDLCEIQLLPVGRAHPQATELLASERMSRLIDELATRYPDRIIIVDSPPMLVTTEARAIARQVGQITLVVEAGRTSQQALTQTLEAIGEDKAVNVILNKSRNWTWGMPGETRYTYGYESR
jgi:exopolysaccharide/PEP-CTERM locus tyrosine autokinase